MSDEFYWSWYLFKLFNEHGLSCCECFSGSLIAELFLEWRKKALWYLELVFPGQGQLPQGICITRLIDRFVQTGRPTDNLNYKPASQLKISHPCKIIIKQTKLCTWEVQCFLALMPNGRTKYFKNGCSIARGIFTNRSWELKFLLQIDMHTRHYIL